MDGSSTPRQRQGQRQSGLRSNPGSTRSSTRLRRRCGLAASTDGVTRFDNDGVVERLTATGASSRRPRAAAPGSTTTASWNGCRRPDNCDGDAPCCPFTAGHVDSAASAGQLLTTATTVHRRRRATRVDSAGSGHAHSSDGIKQLDLSN